MQTDSGLIKQSSSAPALSRGLWQFVLAGLSGGLMSIPFLDHQQYWLTWFAWLPLLIAIQNTSLVRAYLLGLVAGVLTFTGGMYWIVDFIQISKGYSVLTSLALGSLYWLYCAQLIALVVLLFRWFQQRTSVHDLLLFPLLLTFFCIAYPMLFYMRLSETQVNFTVALQATEWVGGAGLDFIVALSTVLMFHLGHALFGGLSPVNSGSISSREADSRAIWPYLAAIALIVLWFVYGVVAKARWEEKILSWQTVRLGVVQPNEVPKIGKKILYPGYSYAYPPEMEMTERLTSLGAELVVWPEGQTKGYFNSEKTRQAYQKNIADLGVSLIFHDTQRKINPVNGELKTLHSKVVMLSSDGQQAGEYQKIKRIPFGEYVPLVSDGSRAKEWVEAVFGEFLDELSVGEQPHIFGHEKLNLLPLICYETTFPSFVANAVSHTWSQRDSTKGTVLLGVSNDGWFGSTHQPFEHIKPSILRAVENRLPFLHVANNGPSIAVTPTGQVIFESDFQQAGGYLVDLPISSGAQGSFYSRHPKLFDYLIYFAMGLIILIAIFRPKRLL